MTPKEEANRLVERFKHYSHSDWDNFRGYDEEERFVNAKQCALICVDEILFHTITYNEHLVSKRRRESYWQQVKEEIQKL